jgi:hypothetical protein
MPGAGMAAVRVDVVVFVGDVVRFSGPGRPEGRQWIEIRPFWKHSYEVCISRESNGEKKNYRIANALIPKHAPKIQPTSPLLTAAMRSIS